MRSTASSARPRPSFCSASSASPPCWPLPCTDRRWRASGWRARSWCRCSSRRDTPSPWPLVIYLAVVAAAAYALARLRRWLWLAAAVAVGVFFWGLALMGQIDGARRGGWASALFVHVGLQLALAAAFIALEPHLATPDERRDARLGRDGRAGGPVGAGGAGPGRGPLRHAVDDVRRRRHGDPGAHLLAQRARCGSRGAGRLRLARRHRGLARPDGGPRAAPAGARGGRGAAAARQRLALHDLHDRVHARHRPAGDAAPGARPRAARHHGRPLRAGCHRALAAGADPRLPARDAVRSLDPVRAVLGRARGRLLSRRAIASAAWPRPPGPPPPASPPAPSPPALPRPSRWRS